MSFKGVGGFCLCHVDVVSKGAQIAMTNYEVTPKPNTLGANVRCFPLQSYLGTLTIHLGVGQVSEGWRVLLFLQNVNKAPTFASFAGPKIHGYSVYSNRKLININYVKGIRHVAQLKETTTNFFVKFIDKILVALIVTLDSK